MRGTMSDDPNQPELVTVQGQLTYKRPVSKRLVFYDLCVVANRNGEPLLSLELVVKEDVFGDAEAIRDVRSSVKLGDEVEAQGHMEGSSSMRISALRVLRRWRDTQPGSQFQPRPCVDHNTQPRSSAAGPQPARANVHNEGNEQSGAPQAADAARAGADKLQSSSSRMLLNGSPITSASSSVLEPAVQLCKYFVSTGRCAKGSACPFLHTQPQANPAAWRSWTRRRQETKHATAAALGYTHSAGEPSKYHRAQLFCAWLMRTFGAEFLNAGAGVVDVAGGQGGVTFELQVVHGIKCTLVEPRPMKFSKLQHRALASRGATASICQLATTASHATCSHDASAQPVSTMASSHGSLAGQQAAGSAAATTSAATSSNAGDAAPVGSLGHLSEAGSTAQTIEATTARMDLQDEVACNDADEVGSGDATCSTTPQPGGRAVQLMQLQAHFDQHLWNSDVWMEHGLDKCSLVLGLHPDQATEPILEYVVAANKAFAIVPCCVFPRLFPERRIHATDSLSNETVLQPVTQYAELVEYLVQKGAAQKASLGFQGADWVVYRGNGSADCSHEPPAHTAYHAALQQSIVTTVS